MKHSNLINTLSDTQHLEIKRWYRNSFSLFFVLLLACGTIEYQNWQKYAKIKEEKQAMESKTTEFSILMERKQKLKKEESDLLSKLSTLENYHGTRSAITEFLSKLHKISQFQLSTISLNKNSVTISGYCPTTQDASRIIQTISTHPSLKNIKLSSLNPKTIANKSLLQLTLRGALKEDLKI